MTLPRLDRAASDALVQDEGAGIERLVEIMARLRDPETGCPWDVGQDFASIAPYTLEEAHEVADAIQRRAWGELKGELGDLLFQSVFHARMAEEAGLFSFADVVAATRRMSAASTIVPDDVTHLARTAHRAAETARQAVDARGRVHLPRLIGESAPGNDHALSWAVSVFITVVFVAVALHALHGIAALLWLVYATLRGFAGDYDHEYRFGLTACGWCWHALGVVWIAILFTFATAR